VQWTAHDVVSQIVGPLASGLQGPGFIAEHDRVQRRIVLMNSAEVELRQFLA
jgi:hypothetical protein